MTNHDLSENGREANQGGSSRPVIADRLAEGVALQALPMIASDVERFRSGRRGRGFESRQPD